MLPAFRLQLHDGGLATLTFDLPDKKVNVFTREALAQLDQLISELAERRDIGCLVLLSGKPGSFVAGADLDEIEAVTDPAQAEAGSRYGQRLFDAWSRLPFPKVAAIQATCLGGGTELSLACDFILISDRPDVRIGLPEIRLGIVPAWGGCSRLPRRVGIAAALDIILAGKAVNGRRALKIGLADALLPDPSFIHQVRDIALRIAAGDVPSVRRSRFKTLLIEGNPIARALIFRQARKQVLARTSGHYPAPLRAIEVVAAAVTKGKQAGLEAEARATGELAVSPVCKNLIHLFRQMEAAKRNGVDATARSVRSTAVLGAGLMGAGIAQLIAQKAELPVRLKDLGTEPLAHGMAHAARLFRQQVKRRRLREPEAKQRMGLLLPCLDYSGLERTELVIEAVVESLEVKKKVFAEVAAHVPQQTILASNTSSLPIDEISSEIPAPERVVGMHFFHPVHRLPLIEVVRGDRTSDEAVNTIAEFARRLGKTPVVVKSRPGFLVNRLLGFCLTESLWLLEDGHSVEDIDRAMTDWGMPIGPLALIDEVGIDVGIKVALILATAFSERLTLPDWVDRLTASDRLGAKSGRGIYLYRNGKRQQPDQQIYSLLGLGRPHLKTDGPQLVDRMILPMVNEAARCLEEKIVRGPADLDLALIMGIGFPPFRGGLCRWADQQGLKLLLETMERLTASVGERYRAAGAFKRAAAAGGLYSYFG